MIDIDRWLDSYCRAVRETFGGRVRFIGIQGSRGRGEGRDESDIDVVLILDELSPGDLKEYDKAISALPCRALICGFISGMGELEGWSRAELFQFCNDTRDIFGNIDGIRASLCREDAERAALNGACGIYHGCVHNMLHEKSAELLRALYKQAGFVLRAVYYSENGIYLKTSAELADALSGRQKQIAVFAAEGTASLAGGEDAEEQPASAGKSFYELSGLIMEWSKEIISKYGEHRLPAYGGTEEQS